MTLYLGIDPGRSGAAALITPASQVVSIQRFSDTERDVCDWFGGEVGRLDGVQGLLEHVTAMPTDGRTSAFKFGTSYGFLRGMLMAHTIPFRTVTPSVWQRTFGLLRKHAETKTEKKNRHKALAQEWFPGVKVTHAEADALLLAEYCRRIHTRGGPYEGK